MSIQCLIGIGFKIRSGFYLRSAFCRCEPALEKITAALSYRQLTVLSAFRNRSGRFSGSEVGAITVKVKCNSIDRLVFLFPLGEECVVLCYSDDSLGTDFLALGRVPSEEVISLSCRFRKITVCFTDLYRKRFYLAFSAVRIKRYYNLLRLRIGFLLSVPPPPPALFFFGFSL